MLTESSSFYPYPISTLCYRCGLFLQDLTEMLTSLQRQVSVGLTTLHSKMNDLIEQMMMLRQRSTSRKVHFSTVELYQCMHVRSHTHTHTCTHAHAHADASVCTCVQTYTNTHIHMRAHTHTHHSDLYMILQGSVSSSMMGSPPIHGSSSSISVPESSPPLQSRGSKGMVKIPWDTCNHVA